MVGPGGQNTNNAKKSPAEIPPYLRGTEGARRGKFHRNATKPPGSHRNCGENPGGLVDNAGGGDGCNGGGGSGTGCGGVGVEEARAGRGGWTLGRGLGVGGGGGGGDGGVGGGGGGAVGMLAEMAAGGTAVTMAAEVGVEEVTTATTAHVWVVVRPYPLLPPIPIVVLRGGMERTTTGARDGVRRVRWSVFATPLLSG